MRLAKTVTFTAAALALTGGIGLATMDAAHAGTTVSPTKNGRTGVTWAYYASSDKLCIKRPLIGSGGHINTAYGGISAQNAKRGKWTCMNMKDAGAREDKRVKVFLYNSKTTVKSIGYIRI